MSSFEPVEPAYFTIPASDQRPYTPAPDRWFGECAFTVTTTSPMHVGSGAARVVEVSDGTTSFSDVVAAMIEHPVNGHAVVPGSSVKGAVRAVFEALTDSCMVTSRACGKCAACRTFGSPGQRGVVGFDDVVFECKADEAVPIKQRYEGRWSGSEVRRFYRPDPERFQAASEETLLCVGAGQQAELWTPVRGVDDGALGALLVALAAAPGTLPHLRIGGGKNRGLGIVEVTPKQFRLARSPLAVSGTHPSPPDPSFLTGLIDAARERFASFDRVLGELRDHYGGGE